MGWIDVTMDTLGGYDKPLCKMMSCLCYPVAPAYCNRKFEFDDRDEWEAWTEADDDCYEEALLELSEQQGRLGDLEVDLINLTHTHSFSQLESYQQQIQQLKAQIQQLPPPQPLPPSPLLPPPQPLLQSPPLHHPT
ncbi:hypothetical protein E2562_031274 [Oryza meyeriana var. granulata]|uniref:Uncharacterized protein n=1 Tax=Oryza meyeriana var. granulata TaxID=110450 RepID=A0A6G1C9W5_9ORYZ|nr:hypothetical protein E2562_031274 [Oryza meyeriana var. granulata]